MKNPTEDKRGSDRVFRLGGWFDKTHRLGSSRRSFATPTGKSSIIGFRIVRNVS